MPALITTVAATAVLGATAVSGGPAPVETPDTASVAANAHVVPSSARRSGLPWPSGAYVPGDSPAATAAFGSFRRAQTDVVVTWAGRRNWSEVVNPGWLYGRWRNSSQTLVLGVPPFPELRGASLARCAAGAYDRRWRNFGRAIQRAGMAHRTVVRLGWEFNGDWYQWSARNPQQFAACWRTVHQAAESTAPGLRWDWTVNRGPSQLGIDPRAAYPGDRYVDVVSVDSYDGWPAARNLSGWNQQLNGSFGLQFWADFARAHRKRLGVPEWGVYPGTAWAGHNGGDNAYYVQKMFGFFASQKDNLAYEAYFNETASYYAGSLGQNPKAAAEYRRQVAAHRR